MDSNRQTISIAFVLAVSITVLISDGKLEAQSPCPKGMVCLFKDGSTEILEKVLDIGSLLIRPAPFDKKAELGKLLFCDHRFSADNKYACAQCHQPHQGFTVQLPLPLGIGGLVAGHRNSPTLFNLDYVDNTGARHSPPVLWDGRATSLKHQLASIETSPSKNVAEMGMKDAETIMKKLAKLDFGHPDTHEYEAKFKEAFPSAPGITSPHSSDRLENFAHFVQAIVAYERTLISVDSPFDLYARQYLKHHPEGLPKAAPFEDLGIENFKEKQWKGMLLFRGKARCIFCHSGPNFTDNKFHNVGWPAERQNDGNWKYKLDNGNVIDPGRHCRRYKSDREATPAGRSIATTVVRHRNYVPICEVHGEDKMRENGAFKTPTLRNVEETWPYMHDGGMPNFEELRTEIDKERKIEKALRPVVDFFNKGGGRDNPFADPLMKKKDGKTPLPLNLTEEEISDLVAFLRSLTGKPLDDKRTNNCPFPPISIESSSHDGLSTPTP